MNALPMFLLALLAFANIREAVSSWDYINNPNELSADLPNSGVLTKLGLTNATPVRGKYMKGGNTSTRFGVLMSEKGKEAYLFFVVIIHNKIVANGNTRLVTLTPEEIIQTQEEADSVESQFNFANKITWETRSKISLPTDIAWSNCSGFELNFDLFFTGSNGNFIGIYNIQSSNSFCVGVVNVIQNKISTPVYSYMGIHYKCRTEAFRDLESYVRSRETLIFDEWKAVPTHNISDTLRLEIAIVQTRTTKELGKEYEPEMFKQVPNGMLVIFKNIQLCHFVAVVVMQLDMVYDAYLSFVGQEQRNPDFAEREIDNYFPLACSDKFGKNGKDWLWGWKFVRENPFFKQIETRILENVSFPIQNGQQIYLQKIKKPESNEGQWIAIYGHMEKLFLVIFQIEPEFTLIFSGAKGSEDEIEATYNEILELFEILQNSAPASEESTSNLPEAINNRLEIIFNSITVNFPDELKRTSALIKGMVDPGLTKLFQAPFNRIQETGPYWYCFAFKFKKTEVKEDKTTFFVIVELTLDGSFLSAKLANPCIPSTTSDATAALTRQIRSTHLTALITPKIIQT